MGSCISQPNPLNNHHHKATTATNNDDYQVADPDLTNMIGRDLNFMKETMTQIQKSVDHMNVQINQACEKFEELKTREGGSHTNELDQLKMSVKKLKSQIPSKLKIHYDDDSKPHRKPWFDDGSINSSSGNYQVDVNKAGNLHSLYNQPKFDLTAALEDIQKKKLCWGRRHRILSTRFWMSLMHPAIRCVLTTERKLDQFGYSPHRCLTFWNRSIVNVDAAIIDEFFFRRGTNLKVVYLGRWHNSVTHHIEISDIKILNGLKNMKQLRFLSLRGISLITELPQFISQLTNLKILDLKACHNLEVVPDWIGLLKNLTHLDISECYFLDHMPEGLGALSNLQVLKGFIIGDSKDKKSCTINDLTKLPKLRKLSISTSMKEFPTDRQLHHLQRLKYLQKLKISWLRCILRGKTDNSPKKAQPFSKQTTLTRSFIEQDDPKLPLSLELPSSLQKLELECFLEIDTPGWLWSGNLKNLKKLYIRGGLLCNLDKIVATTVEMLQLKYLSNLEMPWEDIMMLFPNLIYLEKVECPSLNSFPCDQNGVWMKKTMASMRNAVE
ncbi:Disease resistance RPP13-like protein 4 [Camellia lanceoleosa]|uniref:Disease resistance RPP13-like protein 4 n=1 Tax=Camellia lanceoleosa TaxID=1840588 RepID=A0ACC0FZN1_9ERIC|nr:Disease resistance RPP13-like protein 4 [Camellia lanceoleosa]